VAEFTAEELQHENYQSFFQTVLLRKAALIILHGSQSEIATAVKLSLKDYSEGDDEEFEQALVDGLSVQLFASKAKALKMPMPCVGFEQCLNIGDLTKDSKHLHGGPERLWSTLLRGRSSTTAIPSLLGIRNRHVEIFSIRGVSLIISEVGDPWGRQPKT
jgi:hypothetical protein